MFSPAYRGLIMVEIESSNISPITFVVILHLHILYVRK